MDKKLSDILKKVADELSAMPREEFLEMLDSREEGEISYFLKEQNLLPKYFWEVKVDLDWERDGGGTEKCYRMLFLVLPNKEKIKEWAIKVKPSLKRHFDQGHDIISIQRKTFSDEYIGFSFEEV